MRFNKLGRGGEAPEVLELQVNAIIVSAQLAAERESDVAIARIH